MNDYYKGMNRKFTFTYGGFVNWHVEDARERGAKHLENIGLEGLLSAWNHMDDNPDIAERYFYHAIRAHYISSLAGMEGVE